MRTAVVLIRRRAPGPPAAAPLRLAFEESDDEVLWCACGGFRPDVAVEADESRYDVSIERRRFRIRPLAGEGAIDVIVRIEDGRRDAPSD